MKLVGHELRADPVSASYGGLIDSQRPEGRDRGPWDNGISHADRTESGDNNLGYRNYLVIDFSYCFDPTFSETGAIQSDAQYAVDSTNRWRLSRWRRRNSATRSFWHFSRSTLIFEIVSRR